MIKFYYTQCFNRNFTARSFHMFVLRQIFLDKDFGDQDT